MLRSFGVVLCLTLVLSLFVIEEGRTGSFNVTPLKIVLSGKSSSALLEVTNQAPEAVRLQLSVSAWDQSPAGDIQLSATEDIVLFPPLLTVEPGETRKIRLGAVTPRAASEKTYRVVLEELPPAKSAASGPGEIRVLTRMTIPVFLEPQRVVSSGQIEGVQLRNRTASFQIRNTGNAHFVPRDIRVIGKGDGGKTLGTHEVNGWYILAGGIRRYEVSLSDDECRRIKSLVVEANLEGGPLKGEADVRSDGCTH